MRAVVSPSELKGILTAAASKSAMQRACAAALIKGGETILHNPGISADDVAALHIIQQLGATVEKGTDTVLIKSSGVAVQSNEINCGESGLSVRMFTSIAALSDGQLKISGSGSLLKRPLSFFDEVLPQLEVQCTSNQGMLPLLIKGPLHPKNITIDGSLSSQFLTGLLFAFAAAKSNDITIHVNSLNSKPYIDLTLQVMKDFGLQAPVHDNYQTFYFSKPNAFNEVSHPFNYTIEADWSGAAFLLVAGAVAGNISVRGLDLFSTQADKSILHALIQSEAVMSIRPEQIDIRKKSLKPFHFNATDCPDLFPPLAALAAHCHGTSVIEGVHRLTHKESNRALTIQEEFGKMEVEVQLQDDLMVIKGGKQCRGTRVSSHHDHRIAMACAVLALNATQEMEIDGAEAVNKSYPQFWKHLQQLNGSVTLINH